MNSINYVEIENNFTFYLILNRCCSWRNSIHTQSNRFRIYILKFRNCSTKNSDTNSCNYHRFRNKSGDLVRFSREKQTKYIFSRFFDHVAELIFPCGVLEICGKIRFRSPSSHQHQPLPSIFRKIYRVKWSR